MSTNGSTELPLTGDEGTRIAQHEAQGSETAILSPVGEAAEEAAGEHRGDPDSPLLSDGIHVPSEGLHDESQYSRAPNTSPPAPDSHGQEARDDPGYGGKQMHSAPSRVDEPATAGNEDKTRAAQDRTHRWQTQQLTGWAAVEKTLTDFDQQEVSGYKEDIDSLLTFAGLYSGVLTAFVIVSFTQLQEDTAAESLKVLRIIANQTANTAATMLTAPPPFQPSLTAKRVNVLWFASLIISLSTASLAILVKQWLRGYMAFASSSPQGQLRIRHFRRSGLETWRVFGIASMLPLLLQISLALFFIGLCFFTADIDPVIGYTTLPLVCSWAFLFITVTLAPAFSARCPYKIPALSMVTAFIRTRVWDLLWCSVAVTIGLLIAYPYELIRQRLRGYYIQRPILFTINFITNHMTVGRQAHEEEVDVLNDSSKDLAILASADAIQANFELDLATVEDVLKQSHPDRYEALEFLVQIISNRIPLPSKFSKLQGPQFPLGLINCSLLSTRTKAGIVAFLNQYVINNDKSKENSGSDYEEDGDDWDSLDSTQQWIICLFLSLHEPGASGEVPDALHRPVISWFEHFALRYSSEIGKDYPVKTFTLLCLWLDHGYTTTELPQNLHAIKSIISSMGWHIGDALDSDQQSRQRRSDTLGTLYKDTARKLGGDMLSYWKEHAHLDIFNGVALSGDIFDGVALSGTIWTLCRIAEHWGDSEQCKDILISFVEETFSLKSDTAVRNMLISVLGVGRHKAAHYHPLRKASDRQFLLDIVQSQGIEAHMNLINALCLIAQEESLPEDFAWWNFQETTIAVLQFPKSLSQMPLLSLAQNSWRRPFLILTRWMDYALNESLPIFRYDSSWLISIGEEVDATLSINAEKYLSHSSKQRRNLPLPDIFCLALGAFVDNETKAPIWTAKHLRDISPEERAMIIAEGREEIQAVRSLPAPEDAESDSVSEAGLSRDGASLVAATSFAAQ